MRMRAGSALHVLPPPLPSPRSPPPPIPSSFFSPGPSPRSSTPLSQRSRDPDRRAGSPHSPGLALAARIHSHTHQPSLSPRVVIPSLPSVSVVVTLPSSPPLYAASSPRFRARRKGAPARSASTPAAAVVCVCCERRRSCRSLGRTLVR